MGSGVSSLSLSESLSLSKHPGPIRPFDSDTDSDADSESAGSGCLRPSFPILSLEGADRRMAIGGLLEIAESLQHLPLLVGEILFSGRANESRRGDQLPGEELPEANIDGQIVKGCVDLLTGVGL